MRYRVRGPLHADPSHIATELRGFIAHTGPIRLAYLQLHGVAAHTIAVSDAGADFFEETVLPKIAAAGSFVEQRTPLRQPTELKLAATLCPTTALSLPNLSEWAGVWAEAVYTQRGAMVRLRCLPADAPRLAEVASQGWRVLRGPTQLLAGLQRSATFAPQFWPVLPASAGASAPALAPATEAPTTPHGAEPVTDDLPLAVPAGATVTVTVSELLAAADEPHLLLGVQRAGAGLRLAWRAMQIAVLAPPDKIEEVVATAAWRAVGDPKQGMGALVIADATLVPPHLFLSMERRVRIVDVDNLWDTLRLPWTSLSDERLAQLLGAPIPSPRPSSFPELLMRAGKMTLATEAITVSTEAPADDPVAILNAGGILVIRAPQTAQGQFLQNLVLAILEDDERLITPLLCVRPSTVALPSRLADRAIELILGDAPDAVARLMATPDGWAFLSVDGTRIDLRPQLQATPEDGAGESQDVLARVLHGKATLDERGQIQEVATAALPPPVSVDEELAGVEQIDDEDPITIAEAEPEPGPATLLAEDDVERVVVRGTGAREDDVLVENEPFVFPVEPVPLSAPAVLWEGASDDEPALPVGQNTLTVDEAARDEATVEPEVQRSASLRLASRRRGRFRSTSGAAADPAEGVVTADAPRVEPTVSNWSPPLPVLSEALTLHAMFDEALPPVDKDEPLTSASTWMADWWEDAPQLGSAVGVAQAEDGVAHGEVLVPLPVTAEEAIPLPVVVEELASLPVAAEELAPLPVMVEEAAPPLVVVEEPRTHAHPSAAPAAAVDAGSDEDLRALWTAGTPIPELAARLQAREPGLSRMGALQRVRALIAQAPAVAPAVPPISLLSSTTIIASPRVPVAAAAPAPLPVASEEPAPLPLMAEPATLPEALVLVEPDAAPFPAAVTSSATSAVLGEDLDGFPVAPALPQTVVEAPEFGVGDEFVPASPTNSTDDAPLFEEWGLGDDAGDDVELPLFAAEDDLLPAEDEPLPLDLADELHDSVLVEDMPAAGEAVDEISLMRTDRSPTVADAACAALDADPIEQALRQIAAAAERQDAEAMQILALWAEGQSRRSITRAIGGGDAGRLRVDSVLLPPLIAELNGEARATVAYLLQPEGIVPTGMLHVVRRLLGGAGNPQMVPMLVGPLREAITHIQDTTPLVVQEA